MTKRTLADTEDLAVAGFSLALSLMGYLTQEGLITAETMNAVAANAGSFCKSQGRPTAADLIARVIPTSHDMDATVEMLKRGITITREGQPND